MAIHLLEKQTFWRKRRLGIVHRQSGTTIKKPGTDVEEIAEWNKKEMDRRKINHVVRIYKFDVRALI